MGALKEYLTDITTSKTYNRFRDDVSQVLSKISSLGPNAHELVKTIEKSIKGSLLQKSNFFEALNFRYFGPIDGHDVKHMANQTKWHAPGLFDKITGEIKKSVSDKPQPPKYQDVFGYTMVELAEQNPKIMGITPAMPSGCSLNIMMKAMPDRAFDVGIAEQHAVTFSAGLAAQGMVPFCNIYSSFMQRAYDQVIHDVAIQKLNVVFCLDRGGVAGADGPTHHGAYDLAYMRCIPNMVVSAPMNEEELRNLMFTAQQENMGPFSIRYPRGNGVMPDWKRPLKAIPVGKGRKICDGEDVAILTIGHIGNEAVKACQELNAEGIHPAHYDLRFVKPLDENLLHEVFGKFKQVITVEDGCVQGGMGSAVLEFMADKGYEAKVTRLGMPDKVVEHGEQPELWAECGYDAAAIVKAVKTCAVSRTTKTMAS